MDQIYLKSRKELRTWLKKNHKKSEGVWLLLYKKHTGKPSLEYDDLVEETLCFGWIDSLIKRIDDETYVRKITPRKPGGRWSELNKKRVQKLQKSDLMTEAGNAVVAEAKKSGKWSQPDRPQISVDASDDFEKALSKSKKANAFFNQLSPSCKKHYVLWISSAKRQETRERRIKEAIEMLTHNQKLGMK